MFKLNTNKGVCSVYMAYHVNYEQLYEMIKGGLIQSFDINIEWCKTCMVNKITKNPFPSIVRNSILLELVHSDLCDFHSTPSLGNKKYNVTFVDDFSKYFYVYFLHSKDEALETFKIFKLEVEMLNCKLAI